MNFQFSSHGLSKQDRRLQRFLEIAPGLTTWTILVGIVTLAFWQPIWAALVIIAFDLYWLLRIFYGIIFLLLAYLRLSIEQRTNWLDRARALDHPEEYLDELEKADPKDRREKISLWIHKREVRTLMRSRLFPLAFDDVHHLVLIPVVKEERNVFEPGVQMLARGPYPAKRMVVVLAVEERAGTAIKDSALAVQDKFKDAFLDFLVVFHPEGLPDEAQVKGANVTCAAKMARRRFEELRIPFEHVIVSCFDADTVVSEQYFACLSYYFRVNPHRNRASFQPIPVYHNNIWDAHGFAQVMEMGASFFLLTETTNPEKLVTFSSHSMSFKALVDIGYWPVDMISDDSSIYWKAFNHFDGDYRTIPMYVTVSMDVVDAGSWWATVVSVYKQKRRWAWGVQEFPIIIRAFLKNKSIPAWTRVRLAFRFFERHIAWATWSFLLTIMSWLPALLAEREFSSSFVYYSSSRITSVIFTLSYVILFILCVLSLCLLPKKKVRFGFLKQVGFVLQWVLLPVTYILFSALPALDAQTRLMFGNYLEFWVTGKHRGRRVPSNIARCV
ncbi:MAG: glycosyltransferase family 2 protein [Candidatus Omnitrophica bacterium]|nr:glycosyltransferase family 2 protein [Candidatus Omnitrophota bacterium]